MKAIIRFFREAAICAKEGRAKYFWHNLSCRYDWVWAISHCIRCDGRLRDLPRAVFSPVYAKQLKADSLEKSLRRNQEFVAVFNEHMPYTFGCGVTHYLGECEGAMGGCELCVEEEAKHMIGECLENCGPCSWIRAGYTWDQEADRWVKTV